MDMDHTTDRSASSPLVASSSLPLAPHFRAFPDVVVKRIFSFLDGKNVAVASEVCCKWNEFACEDRLQKAQCRKRWGALETDKELWKLIDETVSSAALTTLIHAQWQCRLQSNNESFCCNVVVHQISGPPLGANGLPKIFLVERRFNILHLQTFVLPDAALLYFEPETGSDNAGFNDFIAYLKKDARAGLALEDQRRLILVPPCEYTRSHVGYNGLSLLGFCQTAYPKLDA